MRRADRLLTMPLTMAAFLSGSLSSSTVDLLVRAYRPEIADRSNRDHRRAHTAKILDGVGILDATFDPVSAEIVFSELERIENEFFETEWAEARLVHGDNTRTYHPNRTSTQRRCDAVVEMARRSASRPNHARAPKPLFVVTLDEDSFRQVCELATGTIIGPRMLATSPSDANYQSVLFDGLKDIQEISRQRNFVGTSRRALEVRDRHCRHASGCDVPAAKCEADHIEAWSKGGTTSLLNGNLLCDKHNRARGTGPP